MLILTKMGFSYFIFNQENILNINKEALCMSFKDNQFEENYFSKEIYIKLCLYFN